MHLLYPITSRSSRNTQLQKPASANTCASEYLMPRDHNRNRIHRQGKSRRSYLESFCHEYGQEADLRYVLYADFWIQDSGITTPVKTGETTAPPSTTINEKPGRRHQSEGLPQRRQSRCAPRAGSATTRLKPELAVLAARSAAREDEKKMFSVPDLLGHQLQRQGRADQQKHNDFAHGRARGYREAGPPVGMVPVIASRQVVVPAAHRYGHQ